MTQALFVGAAVVLLAFGAWHTRRWLPFKAARPRTPTFDEAPLMLDRRTGAIYLKSSSLVLQPGMLKSEFLDSDLYRHTSSARYFSLQNDLGHWFLISFLDPIFENVHLQLFFENDRLGRVDFGWGPEVPVPDWTNERVQADVARYRSFLNQQPGHYQELSPRTFMGQGIRDQGRQVRNAAGGGPLQGL